MYRHLDRHFEHGFGLTGAGETEIDQKDLKDQNITVQYINAVQKICENQKNDLKSDLNKDTKGDKKII